MKFAFTGGKELAAALGELKDRATSRRVADRALRKAAEPIRDRAVELAPDAPETGSFNYLKASIKIGRALRSEQRSANQGQMVTTFIGIDPDVLKPKVSKTKKGKRGQALLAGGGVAAYSIFVETGRSDRAPHPYMRPAFEEKRGEALDRLADDLRTEIEKTAARAARKAARRG